MSERQTRDERKRILVVDDNADAAEMMAMLSSWTVMTSAWRTTRPRPSPWPASSRRRWACSTSAFRNRRLRAGAARPRRPPPAHMYLVAVTGWGQDEDRQRAREAGFDSHLTKPAEPEAVRHVLALASARRRNPPARRRPHSHSQAAPRTPLESPCSGGTSRVHAVREHEPRPEPRHVLIQPPRIRHPAAQHDDVGVQQVDDRGERARHPVLVTLQRPHAAASPASARRTISSAEVPRWHRRGRARAPAPRGTSRCSRGGRSSRPAPAARRRSATARGCAPIRRRWRSARSARPRPPRCRLLSRCRRSPRRRSGRRPRRRRWPPRGQSSWRRSRSGRDGQAGRRDRRPGGGRSARWNWRS